MVLAFSAGDKSAMAPDNKSAALALSRLLGCQPDSLPTLPSAAQEVARLTAGSESQVNELVRVLKKDPPLTAKVLQLANSPLFRTLQPVSSLDRAIMVLGFETLRNLTLGLSILSSMGSAGMKRRILRNRLWKHSLIVGVFTEVLARDFINLGRGYYTLGLLHDLGKVAMDAFRSADVDKVLAVIDRQRLPWPLAEAEVLPFDHGFVGQQLLLFWELPEDMAKAVAFHHEPWRAGEHQELAGVVFLADILAKRLGNYCYDREAQAEVDLSQTPEALEFMKARDWDLAEIEKDYAKRALEETKEWAASLNE
jgi:HD-like signal output (HDOD) protein